MFFDEVDCRKQLRLGEKYLQPAKTLSSSFFQNNSVKRRAARVARTERQRKIVSAGSLPYTTKQWLRVPPEWAYSLIKHWDKQIYDMLQHFNIIL